MSSILPWPQILAAILSEPSLRFLGLFDPKKVRCGGVLNQAKNFLPQEHCKMGLP